MYVVRSINCIHLTFPRVSIGCAVPSILSTGKLSFTELTRRHTNFFEEKGIERKREREREKERDRHRKLCPNFLLVHRSSKWKTTETGIKFFSTIIIENVRLSRSVGRFQREKSSQWECVNSIIYPFLRFFFSVFAFSFD